MYMAFFWAIEVWGWIAAVSLLWLAYEAAHAEEVE
jgi:hypothetical protein